MSRQRCVSIIVMFSFFIVVSQTFLGKIDYCFFGTLFSLHSYKLSFCSKWPSATDRVRAA